MKRVYTVTDIFNKRHELKNENLSRKILGTSYIYIYTTYNNNRVVTLFLSIYERKIFIILFTAYKLTLNKNYRHYFIVVFI